jgi:transcriptional regulator with XRE-family HTH domain
MDKTFGGTIAELRTERGISQDELARLAGVSRNYITKLENGDATNPSARIIIFLANALQVPSNHLFDAFKDHTEKENTTCQEHT